MHRMVQIVQKDDHCNSTAAHRGVSEGVSMVQVTSPCSEGLVSSNLEWFHDVERATQLEVRKCAFAILP